MALPFSEIAAIARIAYTIYDLGFSKYTSSQQEYLDFGKDISLLGDGLDAIAKSVDHVIATTPGAGSAPAPDLTAFETLVGDFRDTLERCKRLIRKNSKFTRDSDGFVHNVQWNSGLGKYVQYLRQRVTFHCAKINLVLIPLKIKMYSDIRRDINLLHQGMIYHFEEIIRRLSPEEGGGATDASDGLLDLPDYLVVSFERSATQSRPLHPFPLDDGIDTLAFYLGESTQKFVAAPPILVKPDTTQYLNLMKCIWLLKQVRASLDFEQHCQDVLWGAYFRQILGRVKFECRRFTNGATPLRAPDKSQILQESESKFDVWVNIVEADDFDDSSEPSGMEVEILRASLPSDSGRAQSLVVFRQSPSRIRLVRILSRPNDREKENYTIDSTRVQLLPLYAFPNSTTDALSLTWKEQSLDYRTHALTFHNLEDIHEFQHAITNFGVVEDQTRVTSVRVKHSSMGSIKNIAANGRAQVWTYRAPAEPRMLAASSLSDAGSPRVRQDSTLTGSTARSGGAPGGWARSFAASTNPSTTIQQGVGRALLERPIPAQLVIFAEGTNNSICFISILIDDHTRLAPENCHCNNPEKGCKKIVIKSSHRDNLTVRVYETKKGREDQLNLAVLGHPEHEDTRKSVQEHHVKFAVVEFDNPSIRETIMNSFDGTCFLMRDLFRSYHEDLDRIKNHHVHT